MRNLIRRFSYYLFKKPVTIATWQTKPGVILSACFIVLFGLYLTLFNLISVFALNDTNNLWTFNTANQGSYTYDSNLVSVDTSAHPISGVNKFTNPAFTSDASSWDLSAVTGSSTPNGWVVVPGNSALYGTNDFLAMKYEAKNVGGIPTSQAGSSPWVSVTQTSAIAACPNVNLGAGAPSVHLMNNNEWMTIARNAESLGSNWFGGTVGTNFMFSGHNDNGPGSALAASTNDSDGYSGTNDSASSCDGSFNNFSSGDDTISGRACVGQRRTLNLSNGSVIWDVSGNVWEWLNNTITCASTNCTTAEMPFDSTPAEEWVEFTALNGYGSLSYDQIRPAGTSYNANQGVGRIYTDANAANPSGNVHAFLRGGSWGSGAYAGAFTLTLANAPSYSTGSIGFRCASDSVAPSQSYSSGSGRAGGGNTITIGSLTDGALYQMVNVGDTSTYDLSAYVYDQTSGNDGGTVSSSIAQLYYNGAAVSTTYTSAGSGWWKLSAQVTGANASRSYGVMAKAGKTIKADDFTLAKAGTYSIYTTTAYSNSQVNSWDTFCEGTLSGSTCTTDATHTGNAAIYYQICLDDGSSCSYSSGSRWRYYSGGSWQNASGATIDQANTASQLTQEAMQDLDTTSQKISVKAIFVFGGADTPTMPHLSIGLTTDTTNPSTNASSVAMLRAQAGTAMSSNDWTNGAGPFFSWTAGADNPGGSGLKGYCLYLGTDSSGNPATAKGLLGTSPVTTAGTTCQFIVSGTSVNLATSGYIGTPLSSSSSPYYLNVKAIDNSGNVYGGSSAQFQFRFDNTAPINTSYISCASGSFSNVADMSFNWPTSGSAASSDSNAGLLGWQYQINSTSGTWLGTESEAVLGVNNYIPTGESSRTLTEGQDGSAISSGNNIVYFRSVDAAGNPSSDATIRTCNLSYGGAAPAFGGTDEVTVTPSTATNNSFALSWPAATPTGSNTITHYYYMINTAPPSTLATLQGNDSTYIDNGTSRTVSTGALPNVNKGSNTVYVVAVDNENNYSPSNYITGTFTLNSTDPDNPGNLVASDSSIKSASQWMVTLSWSTPSYQGAGNLTYLIYRSSDGSNFSQVGSTSGLSYVDTTPSSAQYFYKVYSKDGANAQSSGTNAVSITPTGKWTSAPSLSSGPEASSVTTKKATITWSTSRSADSKVSFGTEKGSYGEVEPSNSSQVTSHSIQLTGLNPGTNYYYKAKWTDEDGNTGTSEEKSFTTAAAPTVKDVVAKNIGLTSAILEHTLSGASKVKIYYGTSTAFGGVKEVPTSTAETTYTTELTGLSDGTKYYYKINTFDSEGSEYEGTILDFTTLPRPRISNVRIQQVANTAQSTILVTWRTNTAVSSIVTYYPEGKAADAKDDVNVALTTGDHRMIIRGLLPQTNYTLIVKGRDKAGNEATSDSQRLTTATDTRPPQISDLQVEGSNVPPVGGAAQELTAQLVVSWNTDEPATSQVEFGEGTGSTYSSKTQEDSSLTTNHLVIISGLTPSKVYHLRTISKDKAGNIGNSVDTVTITPKATDNALDLVITNLQQAFGFLGSFKQ